MDRSPGESDMAPLGDVLRRERLRRQVTLSQVASATKIRESLLRAIEHGDIDDLPPAVFAIGLVQSYARFLGTDPTAYVVALRGIESTTKPKIPERQSRQAHRRSMSLAGLVLPSAIAIVLLALSAYLYQQYSEFQAGGSIAEARPRTGTDVIFTPLPTPPPPPHPTDSASVALGLVVPAPQATAEPTAVPVRPSPTALPTVTVVRGVRIDAQASGRVWVQVEADGKVIFVGIINAGEKKTWNASDKMLVWAGNGGNLSVSFNGKPLGPLGAPGEVIKVTWTATG